MTADLLWALVVIAGGSVNSGYLRQPYIVSYHRTVEKCEAAKNAIAEMYPIIEGTIKPNQRASQPMRCIQSDFVLPKGQP